MDTFKVPTIPKGQTKIKPVCREARLFQTWLFGFSGCTADSVLEERPRIWETLGSFNSVLVC